MAFRDYRKLTDDEKRQWEKIKQQEKLDPKSSISLRLNLYHQYPKAVRHYLEPFPNHYIDTIEIMNNEQNRSFKEKTNSFIELLNIPDTKEREILNYLNQNNSTFIIGALLKKYYNFGHHATFVFPEFPLGTSYKVDYLVVGQNSDGYHFVFIELESPYGNITLSNGDFGTTLRKGESQITDWDEWLSNNFSSLQEYFRKHTHEDKSLKQEFCQFDTTRINYLIIGGRRNDFRDKTYRLQRKKIRENNINVIHYDNLIDAVNMLFNDSTF